MSVGDEKIIHFGHYTSPLAAQMPHTNSEARVGKLLRKMEHDVAVVMQRAASPNGAPDNQTYVAPLTGPTGNEPEFGAEADQPLPRMFSSRADDEPSASQIDEDIAEYKSAAIRGFAVGVLAVLPIIVWITFTLLRSPVADRPTTEATLTGHETLRAPPMAVPGPVSTLNRSAELVRKGDIPAARVLLGHPALTGVPAIQLALGETYDPNMLAAWGALDVQPNVAKARDLYNRASRAGLPEATRRLAGLQ